MSRQTRLRPQRASRSSIVKVTKPDGSVSYETPLSPKAMGKIADAEAEKERARKRRSS